MRMLLACAALGLLACQSTPDECWHNNSAAANLSRDDAFCRSQGDAVGGYLTGGLWGAVAEKRKYNACMASNGWYVDSCGPSLHEMPPEQRCRLMADDVEAQGRHAYAAQLREACAPAEDPTLPFSPAGMTVDRCTLHCVEQTDFTKNECYVTCLAAIP